MIVYHATRQSYLDKMKHEGITPPSFWGDFATALTYFRGFRGGAIIQTETDGKSFSVNESVARAMKRSGYIEDLPDKHDLVSGIRLFEGVVCHERIFDFELVQEDQFNRLFNEALCNR